MDRMNKYLESQNPIIITKENYSVLTAGSDYLNYHGLNTSSGLPYVRLNTGTFLGSSGGDETKPTMDEYLANQSPIILQQEGTTLERYGGADQYGDTKNDIIIPPLNTDARFSSILPLYQPSESERDGISFSHPTIIVKEDFTAGVNLNDREIIPPLNTDIRFSDNLPLMDDTHFLSVEEKEIIRKDNKKYLPWEHEHPHKKHPKGLHVHDHIYENFSWAVPTKDDTLLDLVKKSIIHHVTSQHACGSCWAVCFASTMSDCFVVSGAVGWAPKISSTYLMAKLPIGKVHNMCSGGNPAAVAPYLERDGIADSSCVDYSWCSGDSKLCKSVSSARHFDAKSLASQLNSNIPKPASCYFGDTKRWLYKLDKGSDSFFINKDAPIDVFRNTVRSHILDYGPVIGGYVVLNNFFTGNFTDPKLNGGVYFDRADYNNYRGGDLQFSDHISTQASGLHAVSIVGFGVAKNILYDNNKRGDVPYWHCRNSWGEKWGSENGYFKIAMYPFNKVSQFDKQVMTDIGGPVGSMILIRATQRPVQVKLGQMDEKFLKQINRQKPDDFYKMDADEFRLRNRENLLNIDLNGAVQDIGGDDGQNTNHVVRLLIPISAAVLLILILFFVKK
jgi:hypothetical protein